MAESNTSEVAVDNNLENSSNHGDDNLNDSGIVSSTPRKSSGLTQEVDQLHVMGPVPEYEPMEGIQHQQLGDKPLTVEEENDLLQSPKPISKTVSKSNIIKNKGSGSKLVSAAKNGVKRKLPKLPNGTDTGSIRKDYDKLIQWMINQATPKKRQLMLETYELFKKGEGEVLI